MQAQSERHVRDESAPERIARAYSAGADRPLAGFVASMAAYGAFSLAFSGAVRLSGKHLPRRVSWSDLALISVATFKVARLLAKDPVTSPLRAPFTRFAGTSGPAELHEEVRGSGARKAVGELVSCPFCLGQWTATAFGFGLVLAPRPTRFVAAIMTAVAASDFLQLAYSVAQPDE
jgi:hypothetical protein